MNEKPPAEKRPGRTQEEWRDSYDNIYREKDQFFGKYPIKSVESLPDYVTDGSVLDVGGGEGRNALFLAEQGFDVTVQDFSEIGIEKLQALAEKRDLEINTEISNVLHDGIERSSDILLCTYVLHHMEVADAEKVLQEMKEKTKDNGLNIISTYMNQGELYERRKIQTNFYPSEADIREFYSDWEIVSLETLREETSASVKGRKLSNMVVHVVVRKPESSEPEQG